jgi:hypothetical protein
LDKTKKADQLRKVRENQMNALQVEEDEYLLWRQALTFMKPTENLLDTLSRLGKGSSKKRISKFKQKQSSNQNSAVEMTTDTDKRRQIDLDTVTSLSSKLCIIDIDAYEKHYEELAAILKEKLLINADWVLGTDLPPFE